MRALLSAIQGLNRDVSKVLPAWCIMTWTGVVAGKTHLTITLPFTWP